MPGREPEHAFLRRDTASWSQTFEAYVYETFGGTKQGDVATIVLETVSDHKKYAVQKLLSGVVEVKSPHDRWLEEQEATVSGYLPRENGEATSGNSIESIATGLSVVVGTDCKTIQIGVDDVRPAVMDEGSPELNNSDYWSPLDDV